MVSKDIIEKTIDYFLHIKGVTVIKCKPSYRPHVLEVLNKYADQYGFLITTYKDKDDLYNKNAIATLYDPVNDTMIEFNKDYINGNYIDWNNTGKKKINIEDIFTAYDELPSICKENVNLIKHTTDDSFGLLGDKALAWSTIYSNEDKMFNVVNFPLSYFEDNEMSDVNSYDFLLSHEASHCRDYITFTPEEEALFRKVKDFIRNPNISKEEKNEYAKSSEYKEYREIMNTLTNPYSHMSISGQGLDEEKFWSSTRNNYAYLQTANINNALQHNKASDYGVSEIFEDYAEFGAMVVTGYHTPDNPNSRVKFNGEWMQYREWAKLHPYQIQYFVKDYYNEDVSIEEILSESIDTDRNKGEFTIIDPVY